MAMSVGGKGGGGGRRGGRRGGGRGGPIADINVTPLVDVMLVLLIIFMVAAPMMTQGMAVKLPKAQRSTPVRAEPVYVTIPLAFGQTRVVQINKDEVPLNILAERIRQALITRDDKSVFIRADAGVTIQQFLTVIDQLKSGGVTNVGMATEPIGARR